MSDFACSDHLALVVGRAATGRFVAVLVRKSRRGWQCLVCHAPACWEVG